MFVFALRVCPARRMQLFTLLQSRSRNHCRWMLIDDDFIAIDLLILYDRRRACTFNMCVYVYINDVSVLCALYCNNNSNTFIKCVVYAFRIRNDLLSFRHKKYKHWRIDMKNIK